LTFVQMAIWCGKLAVHCFAVAKFLMIIYLSQELMRSSGCLNNVSKVLWSANNPEIKIICYKIMTNISTNPDMLQDLVKVKDIIIITYLLYNYLLLTYLLHHFWKMQTNSLKWILLYTVGALFTRPPWERKRHGKWRGTVNRI
jgi:hypothetical protein